MFLCRRLISAVLFSCSCLLSLGLGAQPEVSVSIRPLQLIAAAITEGIVEPVLIYGSNQDPHHGALKPSQRRFMEKADIVLWIGPTMETSLNKVISNIDAKVITMMTLDGIETQALRKKVDPHLWLNTNNVRLFAKALTQELSILDVGNSSVYQQNLSTFNLSLDELDEEIESSIQAQTNLGYGIYHNGLQYYEKQFGLQRIVSFTDDEELEPGIRKRLTIKKVIEENQLNCLLVEPSVNIKELSSFIDKESMRYIRIDVLAANIPLSKNSYINFMLSLTDAVIECLE